MEWPCSGVQVPHHGNIHFLREHSDERIGCCHNLLPRQSSHDDVHSSCLLPWHLLFGRYLRSRPFLVLSPPGLNTPPTSYFSPGIAYPSGYSAPCHDTTGFKSITTVTCCPVRDVVTLSCVPNPLSLSKVLSILFCTWIAPDLAVTLSSNGVTSTSSVAFKRPGGLNALGTRMVYQSSNLSTNPSSTSATTSSTSSAPISSSIFTSSDLSTRTKVAIWCRHSNGCASGAGGLVLWRKTSQRYKGCGNNTIAHSG